MAIQTDYNSLAQQVYISYFGRPADALGLSDMTAQLLAAAVPVTGVAAADTTAFVNAYSTNATIKTIIDNFGTSTESLSYFGTGSDASFVNAIYLQVLGRAPLLEGLTFWSNALVNGQMTRGEAALRIMEGALINTTTQGLVDAAGIANKVTASQTFTDNQLTVTDVLGYTGATAAATARTWLATVTSDTATLTAATASVATTITSINTATAAVTTVGTTFTLTTNADTGAAFTGTANADTFNASYTTANGMTFQSSDVLDGGAGTDTLNISVGAAGTYQAQSISNIEVVSATFTAGTAVSLLGVTGLTTVHLNGSTADGSITNIGDAAVAMKVSNTTSNADFSFTTAAVAGAADTANVTLSGVSTGTVLDINNTTGNFETVALTSSGSANILDDLNTTNATALTVAGTQNLTITAALDATVASVNASTFTGSLTATMGAVATATITGGAGNDSLTISAVTGILSVDGGAGDDTVVAATNLLVTDTLVGGLGTDTLSTTNLLTKTAAYTKPATAKISGFETLELTDAADAAFLTTDLDVGINKVVFALAGANTAADVGFNDGASTLEIGTSTTTAAALATSLVADALNATALDADSLAITNKNLSTVDAFGAATIATTDFESITINSGSYATAVTQNIGTIGVTGSTGFTTAETVNFAGSNNLVVGVVTADIINASAMTVASGTTLTTVTGTTATTITGSAGNDILYADSTNNVSVSGGAGKDSIYGGAGNDVLAGDAGDDSITSGAGNDTITAGDGNDTIVLGADFTTGDVIDGGAGTADTLSITSATTTGTLNVINGLSFSAVSALNAALTNVERVLISDALVIDGTNFDMARLGSINYLKIGGAAMTAAESIIGLAANSTVVLTTADASNNDLTLTLADAAGAADAITIGLINNANTDFGDVAIASIENLTITTSEATASSTVRDFALDLPTTTGLTTLTITGTESLDIDSTAINATTINASGNTGFVKILGGSASQTITGTAAIDSIQGGGGADTIDGGAGSDALLSGGTGADRITAGEGADSVQGGAGNDAIILTETTAAADTVLIDWSNSGVDVDTITGFAKGSGLDIIQIDLSNLAAAGTSGVATSAVTLSLVGHASNLVVAANSVIKEMSAAGTAGATDSIFALLTDSFLTTADVEDALESGGSRQLTVANGVANDQYYGFTVLYSDGVDAHLAVAYQTTASGASTTYAAGALTVVNLATLVGVTSIAAGGFAVADFAFI